jgi:hypothetical protein
VDITRPYYYLIYGSTQNNRLKVDDAPLSMNMDHAIVTAAIHIKSNTRIKQQKHTKLICKDEDTERYNQLVKQHLHDNPHPQTTEEAITTLHTAITEAVTTINPQLVHRTKGKHGTRIQADIRTLRTILRCLKRGTSIPEDLKELPVYVSIAEPNVKRVGLKLRYLQQRLNKKAEKRTKIRARMYKHNRSEHFRNRNYGAFLNSALSKFNNFKGIEGFSTHTTEGLPAVDMDPERTKQTTSARIQQQHFTPSIPTPQYYTTRSLRTGMQWTRGSNEYFTPRTSRHRRLYMRTSWNQLSYLSFHAESNTYGRGRQVAAHKSRRTSPTTRCGYGPRLGTPTGEQLSDTR